MNWDSVKRNKRRGKAQNTTQVLDVAARAFNKGAADVKQALKEHDIQKDDYAELVDYTTSKESAEPMGGHVRTSTAPSSCKNSAGSTHKGVDPTSTKRRSNRTSKSP